MSAATTPLNFGAMTEVFQFLMEIDKLKSVQRRTKVLGTERQENSAEHSWHFAVAAMSLAPFAPEGVDINKVIRMALIHDIVEIDAGDVLVYDLAARAAVHDQEIIAAKRPRFALVIDRVMPMVMNLNNQGQSWVENNIRLEQVLARNAFIADIHPELWLHIRTHLDNAHQQGWLK